MIWDSLYNQEYTAPFILENKLEYNIDNFEILNDDIINKDQIINKSESSVFDAFDQYDFRNNEEEGVEEEGIYEEEEIINVQSKEGENQ